MTDVECLKASYERQTKVVELAKARQLELLADLRRACTHLRLGEYKQPRPWRICLDCGAEEEGWDFKTLQLRSESQRRNTPERGLVEIFRGSHELCQQRKAGPRCLVGVSAR